MIYGYCRVSQRKQDINRQIRNILAEYPKATIIQEVFTRTTLNRPEWMKLEKRLRKGDTIVFDSVSRMSGNAEQGITAYLDLYNRGINLVFLKERYIDTDTYKKALETGIQKTGTNVDFILDGINKYLIELAKEQIRLAFLQSQKEVEDLHQRTKEGIETARLAGKQIGREPGKTVETKKAKTTKEQIKKLNRDFGGSLNDAECISLLRISRNTFYKYKKALKETAE